MCVCVEWAPNVQTNDTEGRDMKMFLLTGNNNNKKKKICLLNEHVKVYHRDQNCSFSNCFFFSVLSFSYERKNVCHSKWFHISHLPKIILQHCDFFFFLIFSLLFVIIINTVALEWNTTAIFAHVVLLYVVIVLKQRH